MNAPPRWVVKRGREYFKAFSCTTDERIYTFTTSQRDAWHFTHHAGAIAWANDVGGDTVRLVRRPTPAKNEDPNG